VAKKRLCIFVPKIAEDIAGGCPGEIEKKKKAEKETSEPTPDIRDTI